MSHPISEELLSAYLDGELSPQDQEAIERRLVESPNLREHLEELSEISRRVQALPCERAPADFHTQLSERLHQQTAPWNRGPQKPARKLIGFGPVWGLVAACLLLVVTTVSLRNRGIVPGAPEMLAKGGAGADSTDSRQMTLSPASDRVEMAAAEEAASSVAASSAAGLAVQVVGLEKDQIQKRLAEIGRTPVPGEAISYLNDSNGVPLLVEFTVIDVMDAMDQVQVLVRRQQAIHAVSGEPIVAPLDKSSSHQLTAVYLEMDEQRMAELLQEVPALNAVAYVEADRTSPSLGFVEQQTPEAQTGGETSLVTENVEREKQSQRRATKALRAREASVADDETQLQNRFNFEGVVNSSRVRQQMLQEHTAMLKRDVDDTRAIAKPQRPQAVRPQAVPRPERIGPGEATVPASPKDARSSGSVRQLGTNSFSSPMVLSKGPSSARSAEQGRPARVRAVLVFRRPAPEAESRDDK